MTVLVMFLMVLALVLFFLAAIWWRSPEPTQRWGLIAAGLFCWLLSELVTKVPLH